VRRLIFISRPGACEEVRSAGARGRGPLGRCETRHDRRGARTRGRAAKEDAPWPVDAVSRDVNLYLIGTRPIRSWPLP
jgi:hypothetical protein